MGQLKIIVLQSPWFKRKVTQSRTTTSFPAAPFYCRIRSIPKRCLVNSSAILSAVLVFFPSYEFVASFFTQESASTHKRFSSRVSSTIFILICTLTRIPKSHVGKRQYSYLFSPTVRTLWITCRGEFTEAYWGRWKVRPCLIVRVCFR